jgi:hypothetical protein
MAENSRLDAEWVALSAFRGLTKIATHGDMQKSTYDNALELGGALYPDLLGPEVSVLRRARESDVAQEYREKARLTSIRDQGDVSALTLITRDIDELEGLLKVAKAQKTDKQKADRLKRRLSLLTKAKKELDPQEHSENQLIFRDAAAPAEELESLATGRGYRDFALPNQNLLRVRVLHPDIPEHVTGADIIYERHFNNAQVASIVAVQYKIWIDRCLRLSGSRLQEQLGKLKKFTCDRKMCQAKAGDNPYRFPCCAAFLRPTDKLQNPDQRLVSRGEHIRICRIDDCASTGKRGGRLLEYENMREVSLPTEAFEFLFNSGKIGSTPLSREELRHLYDGLQLDIPHDSVVIYAQEFERT